MLLSTLYFKFVSRAKATSMTSRTNSQSSYPYIVVNTASTNYHITAMGPNN